MLTFHYFKLVIRQSLRLAVWCKPQPGHFPPSLTYVLPINSSDSSPSPALWCVIPIVSRSPNILCTEWQIVILPFTIGVQLGERKPWCLVTIGKEMDLVQYLSHESLGTLWSWVEGKASTWVALICWTCVMLGMYKIWIDHHDLIFS